VDTAGRLGHWPALAVQFILQRGGDATARVASITRSTGLEACGTSDHGTAGG
jgi:hypothetical protein